jgi:hypothetical protein
LKRRKALETASGQQSRKETLAKDFEAAKASLRGSYARRKAEWQQQRDLASQEEKQLDKQIQAAAQPSAAH